jgi:hypothetical protein
LFCKSFNECFAKLREIHQCFKLCHLILERHIFNKNILKNLVNFSHGEQILSGAFQNAMVERKFVNCLHCRASRLVCFYYYNSFNVISNATH